MKRIAIIFALFPILLVAQTSDRSIGSLSAGVSFPTDDFAKKVLSDSTSGFAQTGIALNFNYSYRITHNFGVQVIVTYSSNKIDKTEYGNQLEELYPDYSVSIEIDRNWNSGGLMVGPYLTFPLTDFLSWDIRALGGYFGAYSPKVTVRAANINDPNDKKEYYITGANAGNFGYMLGTGFKINMGSYYLVLYGDYYNTNMKFKNGSGWDWNGEPYESSFQQTLSYYTVTLGVGYKL